jgi:hypothetical protein
VSTVTLIYILGMMDRNVEAEQDSGEYRLILATQYSSGKGIIIKTSVNALM